MRQRQVGGQGRESRAATQRGSREAAAQPPPLTPPTGPQAAGAPAATPGVRGDGPPSPSPREELERDPAPRPSRRLPQEARDTSEPAPTRQDAAQIAPSEGGRARTGVVWGATPPMDRTTPVTPALLPAQGRQRDGTRQSDPPPYRPPPGSTNGGQGARAAPPPARPPAEERHRPPPRGAHSPKPGRGTAPHHPRGTQPPQGVQAKGTVLGPHTHTPASTARG